MAVDMPILEGIEFCKANRILVDDTRKIHELGKPDHLRVVAKGDKALHR